MNSVWLQLIAICSCADISDFRYKGVKIFLSEALMRVSKFIKKILSCSECRLNFHETECTQPSNIRVLGTEFQSRSRT